MSLFDLHYVNICLALTFPKLLKHAKFWIIFTLSSDDFTSSRGMETRRNLVRLSVAGCGRHCVSRSHDLRLILMEDCVGCKNLSQNVFMSHIQDFICLQSLKTMCNNSLSNPYRWRRKNTLVGLFPSLDSHYLDQPFWVKLNRFLCFWNSGWKKAHWANPSPQTGEE